MGRGLCELCWQQDPERLLRQAQRIAARLEDPPVVVLRLRRLRGGPQLRVAARSLMISRLGRCSPSRDRPTPRLSWSEPADRAAPSAALARTLEDFFVDAGLAFPLDHEARVGPAGSGGGSMRPPNRFGLHLAASPTPR